MCQFFFSFYLLLIWPMTTKMQSKVDFFPYYTVPLERRRLQEPYHQVPHENIKFEKNLTVANQI